MARDEGPRPATAPPMWRGEQCRHLTWPANSTVHNPKTVKTDSEERPCYGREALVQSDMSYFCAIHPSTERLYLLETLVKHAGSHRRLWHLVLRDICQREATINSNLKQVLPHRETCSSPLSLLSASGYTPVTPAKHKDRRCPTRQAQHPPYLYYPAVESSYTQT